MVDKSAFVPVEAVMGGDEHRPAELDIDFDDDYFGGGMKDSSAFPSPKVAPPPPLSSSRPSVPKKKVPCRTDFVKSK